MEVCRQYGVEEILHKVLTHNMRQDGNPGGDIDTPTEEQAMAAQRKRMYNASNNENRTNGVSGTFFKNISATASHAVAAISKARFDSPAPRSRNGKLSRQPSFNRQASMQSADEFISNSQQSFASDYGQNVDSAYSTQNATNGDGPEPPRKRQRMAVTPGDSFGYSDSMGAYGNGFPARPPSPMTRSSTPKVPLPWRLATASRLSGPSPTRVSPDAENKRSLLMGLFQEGAENDPSKHGHAQELDPSRAGHAGGCPKAHGLALGCDALADVLLRALIATGANPFRVNASGETALMRACIVTNSMDFNSFPELLDVLGGTTDVRDDKGRTVLHHIAVTSAVKGRNIASRYYLESLLEWVVKQGSAPSSQNLLAPATRATRLPRPR